MIKIHINLSGINLNNFLLESDDIGYDICTISSDTRQPPLHYIVKGIILNETKRDYLIMDLEKQLLTIIIEPDILFMTFDLHAFQQGYLGKPCYKIYLRYRPEEWFPVTHQLEKLWNYWSPSSKLRLHVTFASLPRKNDRNYEFFIYIREFQAYCFIHQTRVKLLKHNIRYSIDSGVKIYECEISLSNILGLSLFRSDVCPASLFEPAFNLSKNLKQFYRNIPAMQMKPGVSYYRLPSVGQLNARMRLYFKRKRKNQVKTVKTPEAALLQIKKQFGMESVSEVDECILCGVSITDKLDLICAKCPTLIKEYHSKRKLDDLAWKFQKRYLPEPILQDPLEIRFEATGIKCGIKVPKLSNKRIPYFQVDDLAQLRIFSPEIITIIQERKLIIR